MNGEDMDTMVLPWLLLNTDSRRTMTLTSVDDFAVSIPLPGQAVRDVESIVPFESNSRIRTEERRIWKYIQWPIAAL